MLLKEDWQLLLFVMAAVGLLVLFVTWPVSAQTAHVPSACQPPEVMAELLKKRYREVEIGWGVDSAGKRLMQMFISPSGETWTLVMRVAGQNACIVAGGKNWEVVPVDVGEQS